MGESVGVAVSFSAGLFSFLSPCVLPLFPSYLSFITGMSVADLTGERAASLGSLAVGVTFATGWTPCVGPILGAILSLASTAENVGRGVGLLVAYSAGLGLPFLLAAAALGPFLRAFRRYRPFIPVVERAAGVILVVVGVLVFTNYYVVLNAWAISLTPDWLLKRL